MSQDDPQRTGEARSEATSTPSPAQLPNTTPDLDPGERKALAGEINSILRGIPFIGPYIVVVKLKWGWAGILLVLAGFMIATLLVLTGVIPPSAFNDKYKVNAENRVYELKSKEDIPWEAAIKNAKIRIWASGVALTFVNPQTIAGKVRAGVPVQLVYVDPCGKALTQRMADESNQRTVGNIKDKIDGFREHTKDFNQTQKDSLKVKLADVYPTMVVTIIDNDLYVYFCPYGAECSKSPVLVFKDYYEKNPKNAAAKFFEDHFLAVSNKLTAIPNYEPPCSPPSPLPTSSSPPQPPVR